METPLSGAYVALPRSGWVVSHSPAAQTRDAREAFRRAAQTGDLQGLLDILAPTSSC
jgi:hypothetical protein